MDWNPVNVVTLVGAVTAAIVAIINAWASYRLKLQMAENTQLTRDSPGVTSRAVVDEMRNGAGDAIAAKVAFDAKRVAAHLAEHLVEKCPLLVQKCPLNKEGGQCPQP